MTTSLSPLFEPVRLGDLELPNRIVMSPLTRMRAVDARTPGPLTQEYYVQRASAGMIITEATSITPQGVGYPNTPGLWSDAQVAGWKRITAAVHQAGGRIVAQLWHVGRISDPSLLDGELPVAPSAIAPEGHVAALRPQRPYTVPRALETSEIEGIVADYHRAALHAKQAGFDGVELHGANGYLLDQFLHDGSNRRTDRYGGSIENRVRFLAEAVRAVCEVWPSQRVGVHLNLMSNTHSVQDSNPAAMFAHVADTLQAAKVGFVFARESLQTPRRLLPMFRERFQGGLVANDSLTPEDAAGLLARKEADAVSFGRLYIANPDLVERLKRGAPLNALDSATIYGSDGKGYVDYPALTA